MQHKTIIGETVEIKSFGEIYRKLLTTSGKYGKDEKGCVALQSL